MKKILLLLLVWIYSLVGFADCIIIDEYKTDVYFANGILTNEGNASANTQLLLRTIIDTRYNGDEDEMYRHIGKIKEAYNETHFAGLGDLAESLAQKLGIQGHIDDLAAFFSPFSLLIFETSHSRNLETQINAYKTSIQSGHKVLVVAHSQGNLFTYEAREKLLFETNQGWMSDYFKVVSIASPAMFLIPGDTPLISWDNDLVAWLGIYNGSMVENPIRKIDWEPMREEIGLTPRAKKPTSNYVRKPQIGQLYGTDWKSYEDVFGKFDSTVHAFTFYMGEDLAEGKILNPFDKSKLHTDEAKNEIMDAIKYQLDKLEKVDSQWKKIKDIGCLCKNKRIKVTHKKDASLDVLITNNPFDFNEEGKIYRADMGGHKEYVRAHNGDRSKDGVFTIEEVDEDEVCYVLKDDKSSKIGKIEGIQETLIPKPGAVQVTLTWENPSIDFDLNVGWNAGEHDIQNTGCPIEHFYVATQYDIYPGTYPIYVNYNKEEDNESVLIPEKMKVIIQVPGKIEIYDIDINKTSDLDVDHVADIFVKYIDGEVIVPDIESGLRYIPIVTIRNSVKEYDIGGGNIGSRGGGYGGQGHWVPISDTCNQSCGCIPCEYKIIPYLEQLLYGPLAGANLALYEAVDYHNKIPLYTGKTTSGNTLYTAGNIEIPDDIVESLQDDTLYLLIGKGGLDIDHDDNFEIDAMSTANQGETHLLLTGKDIKEVGFKSNVLTEIAYQVVKGMIDINSTQEVQNKLNEVALRVLNEKIYRDTNGSITYQDLSFWLPTLHKPLLSVDYNEKIAPLVENLFANRDIYQEAYDIVYNTQRSVPVLQSERFDIDENISQGRIVGNITVLSQGESSINSFVLEGEGSENFAIGINGEIVVSEDAHLDYEVKTYYQLYATASNANGRSKKVLIIIQLHNISDAPEFKSYTLFELYENTPIDAEVLRLEFDPGNSALQSAQLIGEGNEYFKADVVGSSVSIKVAKTLLGYISKRAYELQLQVSNATQSSRSIPFTLIIGDRRDVPRLRNTFLRIEENATAGTVIGKVNIISDGYSPIREFKTRIQYEHLWAEGYFDIDSNGTVRVGSNAKLDFETRSRYSIKVKAVNAMGESKEVYLSVDLTNTPDTPPHFYDTSPLEVTVNNEVNTGAIVGQIQFHYGDSQPTSIRLEPKSPFSIELVDNNGYYTTSGNVKVLSLLKDTDILEYNLTAIVTNVTGDSNKKPIHITINKESYHFSVLEGTFGTIIGEIDFGTEAVKNIVTSRDNKYNMSKYFTLENNGTLATVSSDSRWKQPLNHKEKSQHSFTVTVEYENGTSKDIGITVNVLSRIIATVNTPGVVKKVVLNEAKTRAYIADYDHGMHIVDISDVNNPMIIVSLDTNGAANDLVLSKDEKYVYLLDVGKGLKVIDISDESSPQVVSEVEILGYSFNATLSQDGDHAFVSHGKYGIEVIDISEPILPEVITNIGFMGTLEQHDNSHIMNSYFYDVAVSEDEKKLFIADRMYGLQVIDISDIMNPSNLFSNHCNARYSWDKVLIDEQNKLAMIQTFSDGSFYDIHDISNMSNIQKLFHVDQTGSKVDSFTISANIKILDQNLAYGGWSGLFVYDFSDPSNPIKIASIDSGKNHGVALDSSIAYVANDTIGLTIINLEGIEQPIHPEPIVFSSVIDILESDTSSISIGDIIGQAHIWNDGDSSIASIWMETFKNKYGDMICGDSYWGCDDYDEYGYFDIDLNGSIMVNSDESLTYSNIENHVTFAVYTENENGKKSNQAKVAINIKEDSEWSLQFQKSIIKIDDNVSIGTTVGNVLNKESERELFLMGIYKADLYNEEGCYPEQVKTRTWDGYTYRQAVEMMCTESPLFGIDNNGTIFTKDTLVAGNYTLDIIAVDRFGGKWLENQVIEILEPWKIK